MAVELLPLRLQFVSQEQRGVRKTNERTNERTNEMCKFLCESFAILLLRATQVASAPGVQYLRN